MADDTSFLKEVDDALRAERLEQFWQRFGNWVIGGCVVVVLATSASVVWKNHMRDVHMRETGTLYAAQKLAADGKYDEANKMFASAAASKGGVATLSKLAYAASLANAGKTDQARGAYKEVANDASADAILRGYAALQMNALGLNLPTPAAPEATAANPGAPFAPQAQEVQAEYLAKTGKLKDADALLRQIAGDNEAPRTARSRAMELMSTISGQTP